MSIESPIRLFALLDEDELGAENFRNDVGGWDADPYGGTAPEL